MAATQKDAHEYVKLDGYASVTSDLAQSSQRLSQGIGGAFDARELAQKKHQALASAKAQVGEILRDLQVLDGLMMRETFKQALKAETAREPKVVAYHEKKVVGKKRIVREDKDYLARSQKALGNLQRNLEILKKQIK